MRVSGEEGHLRGQKKSPGRRVLGQPHALKIGLDIVGRVVHLDRERSAVFRKKLIKHGLVGGAVVSNGDGGPVQGVSPRCDVGGDRGG